MATDTPGIESSRIATLIRFDDDDGNDDPRIVSAPHPGPGAPPPPRGCPAGPGLAIAPVGLLSHL